MRRVHFPLAGALVCAGIVVVQLTARGLPEQAQPDQGDAVRSLMRRAGLVDIEIRHDLAGHDRIALARSAGCIVHVFIPPGPVTS